LYKDLTTDDAISGRDFIAMCAELGLRVSRTNFVFYQFAIAQFEQFLFAPHLTRNAIEQVQPRFAAYERLAAMHGKAEVLSAIQPVMVRLDREWNGLTFEVALFLKGTDVAMAGVLGLSFAELIKAVDYSKDKHTNTWDKLLGRLRVLPSAKPAPKLTAEALGQAMVATAMAATAQAPLIIPAVQKAPPPNTALSDTALLERIRELAKHALFRAELEVCYQEVDAGFGWFVEPWTHAEVLRPVVDIHAHTRTDMWGVMAMLCCQWHPDVYATFPAKSLWRRAMTKQSVTAEERTAIAIVQPGHLAFAHYMVGYTMWGTRSDFFDRRTQSGPDRPHDQIAELFALHFQALRQMPERFAHIRFHATGDVREVAREWE
jgi:hypothetical protein